MLEDAYQLLKSLYEPAPAGLVYEVRTFNGRAVPRFFGTLPLTRVEFEQRSAMVEMQIPWCAAYHAVQPRTRCAGTEDAIAGYGALVLDIDEKTQANATIRRLAEAGLVPSAVVASGRGGGHVFLDQLEPVEVAKPVARRLYWWIGGDAVWIVRMPGTMNNQVGVNAPCRLVHLDPKKRYALATVVSAMDSDGVQQMLPEPRCAVAPRRSCPTSASRLTPTIATDLEQMPAEQRARLDAISGRLSARSRALMERGNYAGTL